MAHAGEKLSFGKARQLRTLKRRRDLILSPLLGGHGVGYILPRHQQDLILPVNIGIFYRFPAPRARRVPRIEEHLIDILSLQPRHDISIFHLAQRPFAVLGNDEPFGIQGNVTPVIIRSAGRRLSLRRLGDKELIPVMPSVEADDGVVILRNDHFKGIGELLSGRDIPLAEEGDEIPAVRVFPHSDLQLHPEKIALAIDKWLFKCKTVVAEFKFPDEVAVIDLIQKRRLGFLADEEGAHILHDLGGGHAAMEWDTPVMDVDEILNDVFSNVYAHYRDMVAGDVFKVVKFLVITA